MQIFVENRDRRIYGGQRNELAVDPHFHTHFEIIYMLSGHSMIGIDGCVYDLYGGDLVIVLPHQVHRIQDLEPGKSYLFIVPHNICEEYQDLCAHSMPVNPVLHNIDAQSQLHRLLTVACQTLERNELFGNEILKGLLIIILGLAFRQMEFIPVKTEEWDTFRQIVKYCTENYEQDISLQILAERFYLSRYQISRLFSRTANMNFPRFMAGIRVMEACRLLEQNNSITDAALRTGFSSIRSFNRCFMQQTGMSPKSYKKQRHSITDTITADCIIKPAKTELCQPKHQLF